MTAPTQPNRPLAGILWMVATGLCFVGVYVAVKLLEGRVPAAQSALLRYALGLVFVLPMLRPMLQARHSLTKTDWGALGLRGAFHAVGVILWFYAMGQITLAEVAAMNYLTPVYVTLGAALFLGERLAFRRIAAVLAALLGAAIILRPGFRELGAGHLSMLGAALFLGASYLLAKYLTGRTSAPVVVGMLSVIVPVGLLPFALPVWVPVSWPDLGLLALVAFFATAGHYTMTLSFGAAPVSVSQPVTFLQLVWSTLIGVLFFAEGLDIWVILGGTVILAAVSFISWREAVLKRSAVTPVVPATKV